MRKCERCFCWTHLDNIIHIPDVMLVDPDEEVEEHVCSECYDELLNLGVIEENEETNVS